MSGEGASPRLDPAEIRLLAGPDRAVGVAVEVPAGVDAVWEAWTTEAGTRTFFAPDSRVELRPGGAYEMYFDLEAEPGSRGGEGVRILAVQAPRMLSFTWNAPPELRSVRFQHTHVTVRLTPLDDARTRVTLHHDGWGEGDEWDRAFEYFTRAWGEAVLPRLVHRFRHGPVDWRNPPRAG